MTEFLVLEGKPPINIFKRLVKVYGNFAIGYNAVKKWVSGVESEEDSSLSDTQEVPNKHQNGLACGCPQVVSKPTLHKPLQSLALPQSLQHCRGLFREVQQCQSDAAILSD